MAAEITLVNFKSTKRWEDYKCPDRLTCKVCKEEKIKEEFAFCKTNQNGRRGKCRKCEAKRVAENAEKNKIDTAKYFSW